MKKIHCNSINVPTPIPYQQENFISAPKTAMNDFILWFDNKKLPYRQGSFKLSEWTVWTGITFLFVTDMADITDTANLFIHRGIAIVAYRTRTRDASGQLIIHPDRGAARPADMNTRIPVLEFRTVEISEATDAQVKIVGGARSSCTTRAAQAHMQSLYLNVIKMKSACTAEGNIQRVCLKFFHGQLACA